MTRRLRDIATFDMNLLFVFQAMLEEQNVTRAAQKLGKRQSATSEALSRLREALDDPLFVRSGGTMRPSPRARQLEPIVRAITREASRLVDAPNFDPALSSGEVRMCMTEYSATLLLPRLYDEMTERAPNVVLRCTPSYGQSVEASLRDSNHDFAVGAMRLPQNDFTIKPLLKERLVCVCDASHPALPRARDGALNEDDIRRFPHLKVSIYRSKDTIIDDVLNQQSISLPDTLTTGHYLMAPTLLKDRDLLFICGERLAKRLVQQHELKFLSLPWDIPPIPVDLAWHRRTKDDPLLGWVRKQVETIASDL